MEFSKRKAAALAAMTSLSPDKSPKGKVDAPIIPLLNAINSHPSYFTTSSCSGRISILSQPLTATLPASKKKARGGSWLFVSHEPAQPQSISSLLFTDSNELDNTQISSSIVFRFEPLIIAVESETLEAAQSLVSLAISCGFRESGITSVGKRRVIVAIRCSIRLEVPLGETGRVMVSKEYVEYLVGIANEKMGANRKRTDVFLDKLLKSGFSDDGESCVNGNGVVFLESSVEVVEEEQLGSESKGSAEVSGIDLSIVKVVGEPVDRLFLWGHSASTLDQKKIVVFGGFGGIGRHARRNDLLLLDTQSGMVEIIAAVGAPSPRLGHTSSIVGDFMYVIGGRSDPLNILNEVWVFNKVKQEWKLLQCSGSFFPPRHRHTAAVVGSKIYVFGGIYNDAILSSLYVLDIETCEWSEIEIQGDHPGPRHSHSMDANGSKLYIYGGYNGEKALGDLYCFDTETGCCIKVKTNGRSPNARFSHLMFIYSNYLCILGGCPVSEHQELFLLDLLSKSWNNIVVRSIGEGLFVRSTVNVVSDDLIIIGGGASCYAFGTTFTEPTKINLSQLISLCKQTSPIAIGENHFDCELKSSAPLYSHSRTEQLINGCADLEAKVEESRVNCGSLMAVRSFVLQLGKQYAKLGKDILKKFGWLDLERKVYSQEGGMQICLPVTENFCTVLEDTQESEDKCEAPCELQALKPSFDLLQNISSSEALNLLVSLGARKIVDEVVKVKKTPNSPFKVMKEAVGSLLSHHGLPFELLEQLPSRWERLGDIVVLPVTSFKDHVWDSIGRELWPLVAQSLGTQRLARQGRIAQNGTRDSKLEILVGDNGWVDHRENGITYSFDATKCMFSWGNLSEKLRMAHLDCRDEVIVDLFAGIGYFVLPFLVRANAKMVYACEWNPHAVEALRRNLLANSVADRCFVLEGDNRVTAPKRVANRVCLGLLPSSECSWVTAVRALRDEGGMLHVHGNVKDTEEGLWTSHVVQSITDIAKSEGHLWDVSAEHVERVKWYAPHIRHLVIDVRCKPSDR